MWWNSGTVMVGQCSGTVEQWNSGTVIVEQWNSGTVMVEQWNSGVEQWNSHGGTVWWNSGTVMVEQWNIQGGTVEQSCWNTVVEQ